MVPGGGSGAREEDKNGVTERGFDGANYRIFCEDALRNRAEVTSSRKLSGREPAAGVGMETPCALLQDAGALPLGSLADASTISEPFASASNPLSPDFFDHLFGGGGAVSMRQVHDDGMKDDGTALAPWGFALDEVVAGDTRPTGADAPADADAADEKRVERALAGLPVPRAACWDALDSTGGSWQDVANAQIAAATSGSSAAAARSQIPAAGGRVGKPGAARTRWAGRPTKPKAKATSKATLKGAKGAGGGRREATPKLASADGKPALSEEEQKRIRRVKNRASVEKCRNKQRRRLEALQREREALTGENHLLRNAADGLRRSMSEVLSQVAALSGVNCRVTLT